MTLTKDETDIEILEEVKEEDNELQQINIRNTSNTHPIHCKCDVCTAMDFEKETNENDVKEELNYYKGDSHQ